MTDHTFLTHNRFLLGTFSSNCSGGMTVSKLPERWVANWKNNLKLGQMLDQAGIDFMLPIARWIGYGGETDFHGGVLETITWASALLASTQRITVFGTIHTAANNPVVVADAYVESWRVNSPPLAAFPCKANVSEPYGVRCI